MIYLCYYIVLFNRSFESREEFVMKQRYLTIGNVVQCKVLYIVLGLSYNVCYVVMRSRLSLVISGYAVNNCILNVSTFVSQLVS